MRKRHWKGKEEKKRQRQMSARSPAAKWNGTTVQTSLGTKKHVGNAPAVPDETQFTVCLTTTSRNLPPTPPTTRFTGRCDAKGQREKRESVRLAGSEVMKPNPAPLLSSGSLCSCLLMLLYCWAAAPPAAFSAGKRSKVIFTFTHRMSPCLLSPSLKILEI